MVFKRYEDAMETKDINECIQGPIDFIRDSDKEQLKDLVKQRLGIEIDNECSCLLDFINDKEVNASFEEIVEATMEQFVNVLESFKK